jgi:thioredoxin reductase (NADPH)
VEILAPQVVTGVRVEGPYRFVQLGDGSEVSCQALLIASGVQWRAMDIPGMDRLQGAGVYYGAGIAEAIECTGEDVYIIGGANSAGQAAVQFSRYARQVVMLVRGDSLTKSMSRYLIDQIEGTPNIQVELNSSVTEVHGEGRLEALSIHCTVSGETTKVPATSLYIPYRRDPRTDWLEGEVVRDETRHPPLGTELIRRHASAEGVEPGP